ncbi:DUF4174 domain-containing protein [Dokdonia sp. Hel_I_53]|uniref:DUF4174 domain-containing protein n=1 Tax=Dokdonia sp. Hel_I_53 TaxID=1566287 RepID=UPI00119ABD2E|nr:DUF4174 domain-containing protein [Dokdonia sp. Hel_I_53]TVZ52912.1 uncharacterized protein DUF4174 [Dokdonia sp. Hel_I_53]
MKRRKIKQNQAKLLENIKKKFKEYKLCLIEHTNQGERTDFGAIEDAHVTEEIKGFKVFLVGLDGSVKLESSEVEPAQKFLDLIDSMPMRRNELNDH